ncbi:MAG: secretion protein HlyD [Chlamydiota bacterium]
MFRKWLLPLLALIGAIIAVYVVFWSQKQVPSPPILYPAPTSPYSSAVYGAGMIEASTENIAIGTPFILPIVDIFVLEGNEVKIGDPLLQLDTRSFVAQKETAACQVQAAVVTYENAKIQFSFYERLKDKRAVSEKDYETAYYNMKEAEEQVKVAKATLAEVEMNIERATIRAPVDGQILQVNAHIGEIYLQSSYNITQGYVNLSTSLILMGTVTPLQMRIDIDEEDAWRYKIGSKATAFIRGNASINFPMQFVRVEPYILPKVSFTGNNIERIDTRVLQVLYHFKKGNLPVYPGQLLDVYLETPPLEEGELVQ